MSKRIIEKDEAKSAIKRGVDKVANTVSATLGPKGRNVIIQRSWGNPIVTKDGVTVAKSIDLKDPFENMGAQMVKAVANQTVDAAGDGTTTATVLAQAIYIQGLKLLASGYNPMDLKRGIDKAVAVSVQELSNVVKQVESKEEIAQVGTISANGDTYIGELFAEAMEKVGKDGTITIEESGNFETRLEVTDGLEFDRGFMSPYFINEAEKSRCVFDNAVVLLTDMRLENAQELVPIFEEVVKKGRQILVIADDFGQQVLATLAMNKTNGVLQCCAVKAPGFGARRGEILKDLAILTGATLFSKDIGLEVRNAEWRHLGTAKRIIITRGTTTIVDGGGSAEAIKDRCNQIRNDMQHVNEEYDKEKMRERLSKLSGGVAVIRVGGPTEVEVKEIRDRVEDAMHATRAAAEEGIVPGGGVALLRCQKAVKGLLDVLTDDGEKEGVKIILRSLEAPLRKIVENSGVGPDIVVHNITNNENPHYGYNAAKDTYGDLLVAGIIDPKKVVRCALQNAASVASLLLTTEAMVAEDVEEKE
jgi:chaperonin GroEL